MRVMDVVIGVCPVGLLGFVMKAFGPAIEKRSKERTLALLAEWRSDNPTLRFTDVTRDQLVTLVTGWGIDIMHVETASIPGADLDAITNMIAQRSTGPVIGVHVGNFVGISLAFVAARIKALDPRSLIVGIDPNLTHRGVTDTEKVVTKLLRTLDLQDVVLRLNGYSLGKSVSNDGFTVGAYDPFKNFHEESAPELQLTNLARMTPGGVDFVMLDGNHDAEYLHQEVAACSQLLRPGGCLFLDDICDDWITLKQEFERLGQNGEFDVEFIGTRTGVLIRRAAGAD